MDESEAQRQIKQMVNFILNEAKDKAEEIEAKALEEFNIEKLKVVQQMKEKIRQEMARKTKQLETKRAIARSTAINQARLGKMEKRNECVIAIAQESEAALRQLTTSEKDYKKILTDLMVEGAVRLVDDQISVRCRKKDVAIVGSVGEAAAEKFAKLIKEQTGGNKKVKFVVDKNNSLSDQSIGGCVLTCFDGKIRIDNTLDARLRLQMENNMPVIRHNLFPIQ
eukprot:GEMP01061758.1.p1 GENE.GEMP01061758.1~~GEMP01061758.1.p1  ORF type:complete len:224 (+),score=55.91 GEMP01061758.1:58-729(+)